MRIGFITSQLDPGLNSDDLLSVPFLADAGIEVLPIIWETSGLDELMSCSGFIFRSVWNYHRQYQKFLSWCEKLETLNVPIFNSPEIMKWNIRKDYLLELAQKGVLVPQTRILHGIDGIEHAMASFDCEQLVVKPTISLNGHDTYLFSATDLEGIRKACKDILTERTVILQEYLREITTGGELSFIFFNGEFSHVLRKIPAKGEFRIHVEYGGNRIAFSPTADQVAQARGILKASELDTLYARVDVVEKDKKLYLIELELLDPMLYLGYSEGAPERFAEAISKRLSE